MKKSFIFIIAALLIYLAGGLVLALTSATGRYDKQDGKEQVETIPAGYQHVVLVSELESYLSLEIESPGPNKAEYYSQNKQVKFVVHSDTLYITLNENCISGSRLKLGLNPIGSFTLINGSSARIFTSVKSKTHELRFYSRGNNTLEFYECSADKLGVEWDGTGEVSVRNSQIGRLELSAPDDYIHSVNLYQTQIGKVDWGKSSKDSVALQLPEE